MPKFKVCSDCHGYQLILYKNGYAAPCKTCHGGGVILNGAATKKQRRIR